MKLGLVGYGTIASLAMRTVLAQNCDAIEALCILTRPGAKKRARSMVEECCGHLAGSARIVDSSAALIEAKPDLVAEAAGHGALQAYGPAILANGIELLITSVGALADPELGKSLDQAAHAGKTRYATIAGAVGGLDILGAAKLAGLRKVIYVSRKPPKAWKGTKAADLLDLDSLTDAACFFQGPADEAARSYPQNANVAATIALAGAGFAGTDVHMIADPALQRNVHELTVQSECADFTVRIEGYSAPDNPKTSLTTAYSLAQSILAHRR